MLVPILRLNKKENICNSLNKEKIKKSNINNQVLEYYIVEWLNVYRIKFKALLMS